MSANKPEVGSDRKGFFIRFPDAESAYAARRACNAHDELVEALRYAVDNPDFNSEIFDQMARIALAKVKL